MDKITKFIKKLTPKIRQKLIETLGLIGLNDLNGLDIKPLSGYPDCFRCRIGDIRILFMRRKETNIVYDVQFRGSAYKK